MGKVQVVLGHMVPRQVQHELQVGVLDAVFRCGRIEAAEFGELLLEDFAHGSRPFLFLGRRPQLVDVVILVHAQLFLDGTQLVVQVILALLLVDFGLHLGIDLLLDPEQFHLAAQQRQQGHGALLDIVVFQQGDLVLVVLDLDGRGNEIDQETEILDPAQGAHHLLRGKGCSLDIVGGAVLEQVGDDLVLGIFHVRLDVVQIMDAGADIRLRPDDAVQAKALEPLEESRYGSVRHLEGFQHLADGSVVKEIGFGPRILFGQVDLGNGADEHARFLGFAHQVHGFLAADCDRVDRPRENHGIPEGEHGKGIRKVRLIDLERSLAGHDRDDVDLGRTGREHRSEHIFVSIHISFSFKDVALLPAILSRREGILHAIIILSSTVPRGKSASERRRRVIIN